MTSFLFTGRVLGKHTHTYTIITTILTTNMHIHIYHLPHDITTLRHDIHTLINQSKAIHKATVPGVLIMGMGLVDGSRCCVIAENSMSLGVACSLCTVELDTRDLGEAVVMLRRPMLQGLAGEL